MIGWKPLELEESDGWPLPSLRTQVELLISEAKAIWIPIKKGLGKIKRIMTIILNIAAPVLLIAVFYAAATPQKIIELPKIPVTTPDMQLDRLQAIAEGKPHD